MSDIHNIQKSLADRLVAEFEDSDLDSNAASETDASTTDHVVIGLAERVQEKEAAKERAKASEAAPKKKSFQPIGIALVMFAFAAVIIAGETIL